MKTVAQVAVMLGVLAMMPAAFAKEELSKLDASEGKSKGHWVMFVSKGMAPNAPMGTVAAGVGKDDKLEAAFGMFIESARPQVGEVKAETIKEARESDDEPAATTVIVKATPEQYKAVKAIVDEWNKKEEFINRPNDEVVNFAQEVLDAMGMDRPYRPGLAPVNPVLYFSDIAIVNRKLGKEDS